MPPLSSTRIPSALFFVSIRISLKWNAMANVIWRNQYKPQRKRINKANQFLLRTRSHWWFILKTLFMHPTLRSRKEAIPSLIMLGLSPSCSTRISHIPPKAWLKISSLFLSWDNTSMYCLRSSFTYQLPSGRYYDKVYTCCMPAVRSAVNFICMRCLWMQYHGTPCRVADWIPEKLPLTGV